MRAVVLVVARDGPIGASLPSNDKDHVEEIEVFIAHTERATVHVGEVFLKIDADQTRVEVGVEAMRMAPIPTPRGRGGGSRPCSRLPL